MRNTGTPKDCIMGSWSEWTGCTDCTSVGVRTRMVEQQAETGGVPCKAFSRAETQSCATILNCADSACQYTPWTSFTACPTTCFRGIADCNALPTQFRIRSIARPAFQGGTPCDWSTLIEQQVCLPPEACAVDQSCVAAPDSPEDCIPCPSVGCTETIPFYTFCTRSVLVSQSGAGEGCLPEQLIYSRTCPLPNCTNECQAAYGYGQFTTCSKPCGTGWYISATTCPSITTEVCNTQSCPTGSMVLSQTSCTFINSTSCLTSECLALCASDPTCNAVQDGFRGSATCVASTQETTVWDPLGPCVEPTWEMVNATCLYLCEQKPSYSTQRGIVFHFNDSNSLSCPITPALLSSSEACPITPDPIASLIAALWLGPMGASQQVAFLDPYIPLEFTVSCPSSSDCQYQSWSDAPVWGQCTSGCVNGGIRHRQRVITAPAYFLGQPCDVYEQNEYYGCNLNSVTSATDMQCSGGSGTLTVSEVICHQTWQDNSQSAMQLKTVSHTAGNEVFLYSNSAPLTTLDLYTPPAGYTVATQASISAAFFKGFQSCAPGWFATPALVSPVLFSEELESTLVCPPYEFGSSFSNHPWAMYTLSISGDCTYKSSIGLPSISFAGSVTCPWGYTFTGTTCSATVHAACSEGYFYTDRDGGGCALPLGSPEAAPKYAVTRVNHQSTSVCPFPNGLVTSNTSFVFLMGDKTGLPSALPFFTPHGPSSFSAPLYSQTYHDERQCSYFPSRTDALLNIDVCTGASLTVMYDKPCGTARPCSYTAWVDMTRCGACIPPATKIQTRSIARQPSEGGQDCTQPLSTATDCFGPPCASNANACSYLPFPSVAECSSDSFPANQAYFSEWSPLTINAYADYNISSLFSALSSMTAGSLTNDIAWALNAQCAPVLCLPSISATGDFLPESWAMNEDTGVAMGWEPSDCVVSIDTQRCLEDRIASYNRLESSLTGSFVYDLDTSVWRSISMCPYELACCSWSDCSVCTTNGSRTQTVSAQVNGGASCGLVRTISRNCQIFQDTPVCANSLTCPITTDGTPCNSKSGFGECVLSVTAPPMPPFYYCSCSTGHFGGACNNGCPVGSNGLTCSGNGTCNINTEQCSCSSGWFGPRCDQRGPASIGLLEMLLLQARTDFRLTYTGITAVIETLKIGVTNTLQCDAESNAVCGGTLITGNEDSRGNKVNPYAILDLDYFVVNPAENTYALHANICVNETDAGSSWVPPSSLLTTFPTVCQDIGSHPFNVSAHFTSHSLVPPSLHERRFYTTCKALYSGGFELAFGTATQGLPCQFSNTSCREGAPQDALFILDAFEGSLESYCNAPAPSI